MPSFLHRGRYSSIQPMRQHINALVKPEGQARLNKDNATKNEAPSTIMCHLFFQQIFCRSAKFQHPSPRSSRSKLPSAIALSHLRFSLSSISTTGYGTPCTYLSFSKGIQCPVASFWPGLSVIFIVSFC